MFTNTWGRDFVFDFEVGTDKLDMTGVTGVFSTADLTISSDSGNAIVSFGGNVISVAGRAGQLTADDFLFAPNGEMDFAQSGSPGVDLDWHRFTHRVDPCQRL